MSLLFTLKIAALFAWLLTLHPVASGRRVHAAYGGVHVATALAWLGWVDRYRSERSASAMPPPSREIGSSGAASRPQARSIRDLPARRLHSAGARAKTVMCPPALQRMSVLIWH